MKNSSTKGLHILITGRIQGVGFRYATRTAAVQLGLSGWVRNLSNGQVEACFYGEQIPLEEMLDWCKSGARLAHVTALSFDWQDSVHHSEGFQIRG